MMHACAGQTIIGESADADTEAHILLWGDFSVVVGVGTGSTTGVARHAQCGQANRRRLAPDPIRAVPVKGHSRCNLLCDYCYVYTLADQTWRQRPLTMEPSLLALTARRIAEHARGHDLDAIHVILHGGEPLLAGYSYLADAVSRLRETLEQVVRVQVGLQTNGVILDEDFLQMFRSLDVRVGVSVDGDSAAHDRHRRYARSAGSHAIIARALRLLMCPEYREVYSGLLCMIDLRNDPITVYEALLEFDPPVVDFPLPTAPGRRLPPAETTIRRTLRTPSGSFLSLIAGWARRNGKRGSGCSKRSSICC